MRQSRPAGDVEGNIRMHNRTRIAMVVAQFLIDSRKGGLLIEGAGAFPVKAKTLIADRAMNVGGGVRRMTQDLHRYSYSITAVVKNDRLLHELT